ncbi:MAG: HDOD domain-containing protein [Phycisphaerales bacterium]
MVLIVDGNSVLRDQLSRQLLEHAGCEVDSVSTGTEALSKLRESLPSLVITELALEGIGGLDLIRLARSDERLKGLRVVILTNVAERETVLEAAKLRPMGYILKAKLDLAGLTEMVRTAVGGTGSRVTSRTGGAGRAVAETKGVPVEREAWSAQAELSKTDAPAQAGGGSNSGGASTPRAAEGVDPAELTRALKPLMTRSEVLERVDACDRLRAFSPVVGRLLKLTGSTECSMDQVVRTISSDQAIALKILKLANSSAFARGDSVDSVKTAVMRIGLESIREVVLGINVVEQFGAADSKAANLINLPMFWEHCIGCAVTAAHLAKATGGLNPDSAFTAGLLHDVGRIVFLEQMSSAYQEVVATARATRLPLEVVESRMLLLNHADVTDRLLHRWKFSKEMINPIVFHHLSAGGIRQTVPRQMEPVAVLALANRLTHAMLIGSSSNDVVYPTEELCQLLRVREGTIAEIVERVPGEATAMKCVMLTAGADAGGGWRAQVDVLAGQLKAPFRPLFVSPEPACDAYGVFCRRLAEAAGGGGGEVGERPNVAVVHIPHTRERSRVSALLREADERLSAGEGAGDGPGPLPVLVISPLGRLELEPGAAGAGGGRVVRAVAAPLVPTQFVAQVNAVLAATTAERAAA